MFRSPRKWNTSSETEQRCFFMKTHGMRYTRFYRIWLDIPQRCNNPKRTHYKHYGGKGVKCRWKSFEEFKNDMYETYLKHVRKHGEAQTTIDRKNNNGDYHKKNCRWATWEEQRMNKADTIIITYQGTSRTAKEWAEKTGIKYRTIVYRFTKAGWSPSKTLTISPPGEKMLTYKGETETFSVLAKRFGQDKSTLHYRIYKAGWSIQKALETPPTH